MLQEAFCEGLKPRLGRWRDSYIARWHPILPHNGQNSALLQPLMTAEHRQRSTAIAAEHRMLAWGLTWCAPAQSHISSGRTTR